MDFDYKIIYEDRDIKLFDRVLPLQDSTDEQRNIVLKIGDKEYGFGFAFGNLIHIWQK